MPPLKLFISSPGDVNAERVITGRVVDRLGEEFEGLLELDPIFWEHEPMRMTDTFQTQIIPTSETDIFICILWSRIGTRLPAKLTRADGSRYESGTEYEFEDAWAGHAKTGKPEMLIYRKMAKPPFLLNPDAPDYGARLAQKEMLEAFFRKWFQDEEGSFVSAFNPFDGLDDFEERLEDHLRKVLESYVPAEQLRRKGRSHTWRRGSPFRGLQVFEAEHAPVFFGRTRAIGEIIAAIRAQAEQGRAFVMVLGMSGSGKSSVVRAGVLPLLTQEGVIEGVGLWLQVVLRPSDISANLAAGAARCFLGEAGLPLKENSDPEILENLFRTGDRAGVQAFIAERLALAAKPAGFVPEQVRLVVLLDQMEEFFTQREISPEARGLFVEILDALARNALVWVIATFRSDFYHRCAELPKLVALMEGRGQYLLTPPSPSAIGQMIRMPAKAAGLRFEQHPDSQIGLDEVLLDAMVKNPESLALLEFTLEALYQRRDEQGLLSHAAYEAMSGLEGALAQRAEAVFRRTSPEAQAAFPDLMRALVTTGHGEKSPISSRRAHYEALAAQPAINELMQALIQDRLLVTGNQSGRATVSVAHEALLHNWPRLQAWVEEDRHQLQVRARLAAASEHWDEEGRSAELLIPTGKPLLEAEDLLAGWEATLEGREVAFIRASLVAEHARRQATEAEALRKLRRGYVVMGMLAVLALVALVGAVYGKWQADQAHQAADQAARERDKALQTQSLLLADLSRQQAAKGDTTAAIHLALEALPERMDQPNRPYEPRAEAALYHAALAQREARVLRGHENSVSAVDFSPDGRLLVTSSFDNTARLWRVDDGALVATLTGHDSYVWMARFSPHGRYIITVSADNSARLWDGQTGALLRILRGHRENVGHAAFSPDGERVLTVSAESTARIWDCASGKTLFILKGHHNNVNYGDFSPDGKHIVTTSFDYTARIWSAADGSPKAVLRGHAMMIRHAAFSHDGLRLVTASGDHSARVWEVATGRELLVLRRHQSGVRHAEFSPNDQWIITASRDQTALVWDSASGSVINALDGHREGVAVARFSPDQQFLVTASDDGTARLWPWEPTREHLTFIPLMGHAQGVFQASFSPDSQLLATASGDHTARLWRVSAPSREQRVNGPGKRVEQVVFSPDGRQLAISGEAPEALLYDPARQSVGATLDGHREEIGVMRFTPDGQGIITTSVDGGIRVWTAKGELRYALIIHHGAINALDISPDGQWAITGSEDKIARLWRVADGRQEGVLEGILNGHQRGISDAVFNHRGDLIATASKDRTVRLWAFRGGNRTRVLKGHRKGVKLARFSPDDESLLTVSWDHTIRLWDVASGRQRYAISSPDVTFRQALFSPDGQWILAIASGNVAELRRASDGTRIHQLRGHAKELWHGAFHPNSQRVITVSSDTTARLWDVATGKNIGMLEGHAAKVSLAAFHPDGTWVATASVDGTARLWRVFPSTQALIDYANQRLPRDLTTLQRERFYLE